MPIKTSAKKYMRTSAHKAQANRITRGVFRAKIKALMNAISEGKLDDAKTLFKESQKALDKAAQKGVLKKNTVARKKSRINKMIREATAK